MKSPEPMRIRPRNLRSSITSRHPGGKLGQALVETALILPILLLMLVGIIEFGRLLFLQHAVTNAAREGGRVAILQDKRESDVRGTVEDVLRRSGLDPAQATMSVAGLLGDRGSPTNVTVTYPFRSGALAAVLAIIPDGSDNVSELTITASSSMCRE